MFVTEAMIGEMEAQFGAPKPVRFRIESSAAELTRIRQTQKHGRNHDATLYVRKGDQWIVIAKHMYPPDLYRAPSGGIHPGETFLEGVYREVGEEIGCEINLLRFLLRTSVDFVHEHDTLFWRSFVFLGEYVAGDFSFTDHDEIREVHLASLSDFDRYGSIMRSLNSAGLHYRAALHEAVLPLL